MKISIITINYNNAIGLDRTIRSVTCQSLRDFEFLVIDGNSTDSSQQVLLRNRANIHILISEPDGGIFHAMNKGIQLSTGDYLLFLNSGDVLKSDTTIEEVVPFLNEKSIIYGDVVWRDNLVTCYPSILRFSFLKNRSLPHQGTFIKKDIFSKVGLYDEELKITGDWKFFVLAICKYKVSYKKIPRVISIMEPGGISDSSARNTGSMIIEEKYSLLSDEFDSFLTDYRELEQTKRWIQPFRIRFWMKYFSKYRKSTAVSKYDW